MAVAKLIKSSEGQKSNPSGAWYVHDQVIPFIQGVITSDLDISQVSSALISGIPTPWARPKLFWFAFDYLQRQDANIQTSGLIEFYKILIDEWKGLIAVMALYPDRITISNPVYMDAFSNNIYDMTSALGRMLMDDIDLWVDPVKKRSNPDEKPFLQLISYNKQLIAGTSPYSIVFPGVDYSSISQISDIKWYRKGKFEDPLNFLDKDRIQKLYLFISNLNKNIAKYTLLRDKNRMDLRGLTNFMRRWQEEIGSKESGLENNGAIPKYLNFAIPYKFLFASEQIVYQYIDGSLSFHRPADSELKEIIDDLQLLLKDDQAIFGWCDTSDDKKLLSSSAVYYLKVNDIRDSENPSKYFPLPLSMKGIKMFYKDLGSLLDGSYKNSLTGSINEQGNLIVELTVEIDGKPVKLTPKEYEISYSNDLQNNKVIIWPNFISENWDSYYLYTEFPLNAQGIKFVPFFKECQTKDSNNNIIDTHKIISIEQNNGNNIIQSTIYSNSSLDDMAKIKGPVLTVENLITYPAGQVGQDIHKYQVIKSNKPVAGLEIRIERAGTSKIAGYLIVKSPNDLSMGQNQIADLSTNPILENNKAIVGIDFGSNNTAVHYRLRTGDNESQPIKFSNRRMALIGIDSHRNTTAERDELLFFSNKSSINGQVKSWLHEHDVRFIGPHKGKELAGGVPVNERNIIVKEMDRMTITTQAGVLHYNMKWISGTSGINKKIAYLKTLWLSICADLYAQGILPVEIRWSYPGSMSSHDQLQIFSIFKTYLPPVTPILDWSSGVSRRAKPVTKDPQTEAEAVCKYALSKKASGLRNDIFLGIDVGGSTSDILILAKDQNNNAPTLFLQSSVRLASGVFFDAIINSQTFRRAIYDYHQQQNLIKVENIRDIQSESHKAPFFLNSLFDQLSEDNFGLFYSYIGTEASFVFALPAYVTGLLLYYSGKLVSKAIKSNNLSCAKTIHLLPFGKGGRIFNWLQAFPDYQLANDFYQECFLAGFGQNSEVPIIKYRNDISVDNKSEVAIGLAVEIDNLVYQSSIRSDSDVFGEKNIKYFNSGKEEEIGENDVLTTEKFVNIDNFVFPDTLENFNVFLKIFLNFIGPKTGLFNETSILEEKSKELPSMLEAFIRNDSEYRKASELKKENNNTPLEYKIPILIAEGLCYLENILIPEVFKS